MTISSTKWLSLFFFFGLAVVSAQDNLTGYWQTQFAIDYDVTPLYSHNFSVINRNYVVQEGESKIKTRHLDVVHFSKINVQNNQSIALGILYRFREAFEDSENELRLTQQFNLTSKPYVVRFGHRIRSEQRITKSATVHRFRYRFAVDFPLKGEKLDIGEPYFVGTLENLLSVARSASPQYDTRLTGFIGWQLDANLKLQFGVEYRLEEYTSGLPQNMVFLLTTAQLSL